MLVNSIDSTNFGKLYTGYTIKKNIIEKNHKSLIAKKDKIARAIRKENLHKAENVDIILQYRRNEGFYGIISSKTQGTPNHPLYCKDVSTKPKEFENFKKWVEMWDNAYKVK